MCMTVFLLVANANDPSYLQVLMAIDSLSQVPCQMHQEIEAKWGRRQGLDIASQCFSS